MPSAAAADHPGDPEAMPAGDLAARVRGRGPFGAMAARVLGRREDLVLLDLAEELLPQRPGQPVPGLVRALLTLPGDGAAAPSANDQAGPRSHRIPLGDPRKPGRCRTRFLRARARYA